MIDSYEYVEICVDKGGWDGWLMWAKCAGKCNFNSVAECELPEATEGSSDRITIEDGSGLELTGRGEWQAVVYGAERAQSYSHVLCDVPGCPVQKMSVSFKDARSLQFRRTKTPDPL